MISTATQEIEGPDEERETNIENPTEEGPILGKRQSKKPTWMKDFVSK
jgi:hypothetical protein